MIEDWLQQNVDGNILYTGNGKELHMNCPACTDQRHRLYVSRTTFQFYCHNCGFSGDIVTLIQWVNGTSRTKAFKLFNEVKGSFQLPSKVSDTLEKSVTDIGFTDSMKRPIPLPDEYMRMNPESSDYRVKNAVKYLTGRGITKRQIVDYEFGFCKEGKYNGRIIIPIKENSDLKFWVARASNSKAKKKELSPSDNEWNISKSEVLFNIDKAASKYHTCVLCEGIFDALSFSDIGVSMLGKTLYESQLALLLNYKELLTNGIYMAVDYDAKETALKNAKLLSQYFTVYIVDMPNVGDDPNSYLQEHGRKALINLLSTAKEYNPNSVLSRLGL